MKGSLDWSVERSTWPLAETSRFVQAGGIRWHVQVMGAGPPILLIHGTGASGHSWRAVAPLLARHHTVIVPDLPGHAFTELPARHRLSLPSMSASLGSLISALALPPQVVVGHSAGAAILIRCCLDGSLAPDSMISINGALLPFRGPAGFLLPPLAKLLFLNPLSPRVFARSAKRRERVARLIAGTGSHLDEAGIDLYARLFGNSAHVSATLGMMANWDLRRFAHDLPGFKSRLLLIATDKDLAVAPVESERVGQLLPSARVTRLPDLGHLAHEEEPAMLVELIDQFVDEGRE